MKRLAAGILIGILIGLAGWYIYLSARDSPLKRENDALKKEIASAKTALEFLEKEASVKIEELLETIGGLQGNIDSLMFVSAQLEEEVERLRGESAALEAETAMLKEELQPVIDANPRLRVFVDGLFAQIAKERELGFTLARRCDTLEEAFLNSEKKSVALAEEVEIYKGLWTREKDLRGKVELRLNLQDKRVVSLERRITLTSVAGVTVAVVALVAILFR